MTRDFINNDDFPDIDYTDEDEEDVCPICDESLDAGCICREWRTYL